MSKTVVCFQGHVNDRFQGANCRICGASLPLPNYDDPKKEEYPVPEGMAITFGLPEASEKILAVIVSDLNKKNELLLKHLASIQITNPAERTNCSNMLTNARTALREAKESLAELTRPAKEEIDDIKSKFSPFIEQVETGIKSITKAMKDWDTHPKQVEILEQVNRNTGEISLTVIQPKITKTTQSDMGSDTIHEHWKTVIDNPELVERKYCDPSLKKIKAGYALGENPSGTHQELDPYYTTRTKGG
jgi:hypothetical protein